MGAVAGVDEMGVAIDQAGRDPAAVERNLAGRIPAARQLRHRPGEHDPSRLGDNRAVLDDTEPGPPGRERRNARIEPDCVEPHAAVSVRVGVGERSYTFRRPCLLCADGPLRCHFELEFQAFRCDTTLYLDHALLPSGWARDVRIDVADGLIVSVEAGAARSGTQDIAGIALPGLPNLHCHAFQRGMAGRAERRGPSADSFWTWREVMYRYLDRLDPDDVEAIAAFAYMEMLEAGFTTVGEFHYLHHDPGGHSYDDLGEMAGRIAAASAVTRIGLTLLPSLYINGGFGGAPATAGQRRFLNGPDRFLKLVERTRAIVAGLPSARVGIAPHSLRAVTPHVLRMVCDATPDGPIHIHAAEQSSEVEESLATLGQRPVEWLLREVGIDERWCLIHATHATEREIRDLAASGAVADFAR